MSAQVLELRRGRPVLVEPTNLEEARTEVNALRVEAREVAGLIPSALAVHRYIQTVGESIEAERHVAYIVGSLERIARRHA